MLKIKIGDRCRFVQILTEGTLFSNHDPMPPIGTEGEVVYFECIDDNEWQINLELADGSRFAFWDKELTQI